MLVSPSRTISGKVELYDGSTLITTFSGADKITDFTVNRVGDTKFFGYGYNQELELHLIDNERAVTVCKGNKLKTFFGVDDDYITNTPTFIVRDVVRDENTNALTIKASDIIYSAKLHILKELKLPLPYTVRQLAEAIATFFELTLDVVNVTDGSFDTSYEQGGNFSRDELLRTVLDYIAEVTQTIYYIGNNNNLVFKRLKVQGNAILTIDKSNYFTLKSKDALTLIGICHTTELGDNNSAILNGTGYTQYVRDNPLWNLRTDLSTLLMKAMLAVGGLSINPFTCEWRGNYLLELGDKVNYVTKNDVIATTYYLTDKLTYNGGLRAVSSWTQPNPEEETSSNPTNLGDKLNQTFARVDKVNKQIDLVVEDVAEQTATLTQLQLTTTEISATVSSVETSTQNAIDALDKSVQTLTSEVNAKVTDDDVTILITKTLADGVDKVVTASKKYTFDDTGLNVSSSDSDMSTVVSEDGMTISRRGTEVLVADNEGVKAEDLHAKTYLIIGNNSRLEDWQDNYTACFWIGG